MSDPLRSEEGSLSDFSSDRREELRTYDREGTPSPEDKVSVWWKEKFGDDERGEGRALQEPWYTYRLWDRKRKGVDLQNENESADARSALAEENTCRNKGRKTLLKGTGSSCMHKSRLGVKPSDEPCGKRVSDEPCEPTSCDEPCRRQGSDEPWRSRKTKSLGERPKGDLDEVFSVGNQLKEVMRRIIVPKGTYTPGETLRLKKSGVEVVEEGDCESENELESIRRRIKIWRKNVHRILEEREAKTWRSDSTSAPTTEEESDTTHVSDSEPEEDPSEMELKHRGTYLYTAGTVELLQGGYSLKDQQNLAEAVLSSDRKAYENVVHEVNTKYKPVGKKILPIPIALPTTDNPPLRRPPLSRDPNQTPLNPDMPKFEPGGKLTEERLALMDFGPDGWLSGDERNLMLNVLRIRERALAFDGTERGELKSTYGDPYKIPVVPHTPWRQSALPIPLAAREKIIETFKARMEEGLYERSTSAYSGRWFVVAKKDGKYRIVHDLQPLNAVTIRDAGYPPVIEEFIEDFTGRACLGLADVYGGYDQRVLAEESRDLTTFQTPLGPVRLTRLPQGATNSVAEYQRVMVHVLAEEIPEYAGVFVDDVGIKGPTTTYNDERLKENPSIRRFIWEYAVTLERILFRIEEAGLTISGPKAAVVVPALNIVGTVCSLEGRSMSKSSKNKIADFPIPQDVTEVRGFLGICTYVRNWIDKFADVARPLRDLTRNGVEFLWTEKCQQSFEKLKEIVGKDLLLAKLKYGPEAGKIILAVDSSQTAAGGVIFQEDENGKRRPARYESLTFTETESRYSQPKLELAGVAKVLKKLQMFLWGQRFTLEIDASALVQMLNAPELPNAPMNRWLRFIQLFDFEVVHVAGKKHTLADGLSRARRDEHDDPARDLDSLISAHVQLILGEEVVEWQVAFVEADYQSDKGLLRIGKYLSSLERPKGLTRIQWLKFQKRASNFALDKGRLWRRRGGMFREVVLDKARQLRFLEGVHDTSGHRGREETSRRISERAWWPGWTQTVKEYVRTCDECQRRKPKEEREARNPTMSAGFFRKFNMDVTHIKEGSKPYLLTAREDLTGWVEGKALANITSKEVENFLSRTIIPRFGWFYQATVDGGAEFKGEMIRALKEFGIRRIVIAPYHPEANGMEERGHQPLVDTLVKISDSPKMWAKHLPMVLFADRISMRRTTGMTPYAMLYGTEAVLPVDQSEETWVISEWEDRKYTRADLLKARFDQLERKSDLIAKATLKLKAARLASVLYHDRVNSHRLRDPLKPGALVLVHNAKLDNVKGEKFLPRWTGPYRVRERLTKGSYLLEELDETPLKKIYAARRVRRYYPRGKRVEEIEKEELTDHEDLPEDIWNGGDDVPVEDLEEGEAIVSQRLQYGDEDGAYVDSDAEGEVIGDRKPLFALPSEEDKSERRESSSEEEVPTNSDESSEEEAEGRPVRKGRAPTWLVKEGWNLDGETSQETHSEPTRERNSRAETSGRAPEATRMGEAVPKRGPGRPRKVVESVSTASGNETDRQTTSEEEPVILDRSQRQRRKPQKPAAEGYGNESSGSEAPTRRWTAAEKGKRRAHSQISMTQDPKASKVSRDLPDMSPQPKSGKRSPGRPRKSPIQREESDIDMFDDWEEGEKEGTHEVRVPAKRGRGRPRRQ
ncbi:hypothetical protein P7C70_g5481, partial [Phenoliferia sp. Uapishka_3]